MGNLEKIYMHTAITDEGKEYHFSAFYPHSIEDAVQAIFNLYTKHVIVKEVKYEEFNDPSEE
jgi:hypothetical protein